MATASTMQSNIPICSQFFKVMMAGFHTRLSLPVAFCKHLIGEKTQSATLTSRWGSWRVKVGKCSKGFLHFEEGWDSFAQQHGLDIEDFVVFEHMGKMHFNVFMFDSSACEKAFFLELENERERALGGGANRKSPLEAVASCHPENPHFETTMKAGNASRRRPYMNIPKEFVESNGLSQEINIITLKDPSGKLWPIKLKTYRNSLGATDNKRTSMTSGWYEFYASNKLKEGDICRFELNGTARGTETILMDVKIFPLPTNK